MILPTKKLKEEDLEKLKGFQTRFNNILLVLGEISLKQKTLDKSREEYMDLYSALEKEQDEYAAFLQDKYGEGRINLETGELIPDSY